MRVENRASTQPRPRRHDAEKQLWETLDNLASMIEVERDLRAATDRQVAGLRTAAAGYEGTVAELRAQVDELRTAAAGAAELRAQGDELRTGAHGAAELRAQVDDSDEEHQHQIEALQDLYATATARFVAVEEQIIAVDKRARSTLAGVPKKLMLDRAGQLVAAAGEGECSVIGQVCGRDGVDGISVKTAGSVAGPLFVGRSGGGGGGVGGGG